MAHSTVSLFDRSGLQMSLVFISSRLTACTVSWPGRGGITALSVNERALYETQPKLDPIAGNSRVAECRHQRQITVGTYSQP